MHQCLAAAIVTNRGSTWVLPYAVQSTTLTPDKLPTIGAKDFIFLGQVNAGVAVLKDDVLRTLLQGDCCGRPIRDPKDMPSTGLHAVVDLHLQSVLEEASGRTRLNWKALEVVN